MGTATPNDRTKFAPYTRDGVTGLDYADQRMYASSYGRFNTPDPYSAAAQGANDPGAPQTWNRYAYVTGDPTNFLDPNGTCGTPSESYTKADGTMGISVSIPCSSYSDGFFWLPGLGSQLRAMSRITQADYDDFHGILPKCPTGPTAPAGLSVDSLLDLAYKQMNDLMASRQETFSPLTVAEFFYNAERTGGEVDFKRLDRDTRLPGTSSAYADFGNFFYGVLGLNLGFSQQTLLQAAGWHSQRSQGSGTYPGDPGNVLQILPGTGGTAPYGDDPNDQKMIQPGFKYFQAKQSGMPMSIQVRAGVLLGTAFALTTCGNMCGDEKLQDAKTPDGRYISTVYIRDCGATTDYVTHVQIRDSSSSFNSEDWDGVVLTAKYRNVFRLIWKDNNHLAVACMECKAENILRTTSHWRDITIVTEFGTANGMKDATNANGAGTRSNEKGGRP